MDNDDAQAQLPEDPPRVVIDTNVVLDCLLFDEPTARPLGSALADGRLVWVTTEAMLDELADVLGRPFVAARGGDAAALLARARALCQVVPAPPATADRLACADPDDQPFIDLALALPARWLFSRDRDLLALARRAAARRVDVLRPMQWAGLD